MLKRRRKRKAAYMAVGKRDAVRGRTREEGKGKKAAVEMKTLDSLATLWYRNMSSTNPLYRRRSVLPSGKRPKINPFDCGLTGDVGDQLSMPMASSSDSLWSSENASRSQFTLSSEAGEVGAAAAAAEELSRPVANQLLATDAVAAAAL